jgi:enoyl-CoA hydratase/carnithine racemase
MQREGEATGRLGQHDSGAKPSGQAATPLGALEHVQYVESDRVGLLTIKRPAVHNAISLVTMDELDRVLKWLETEAQARAVVITGAGDRVFVSGGDLKDFERIETHEAAVAMSHRMQELMARFEALPMPVIGAINGDCLGGGCEVALAADVRIVSENAHFGFKQVTLGITPAWGGLPRLVQLIGRARALILTVTGETVDANEAERMGLAERVVAPGEVLAVAMQMARSIASNPPLAVRTIKQMINRAAEGGEDAAFEADLFARTWVSEDHQEALAARKAKRDPRFRGR